MPRGPKLPPLTLSDEQRDQLQGVARSTSLPHGLVLRVPTLTNRAVAERVRGLAPSGGPSTFSTSAAFRACTTKLRRREGRRTDHMLQEKPAHADGAYA